MAKAATEVGVAHDCTRPHGAACIICSKEMIIMKNSLTMMTAANLQALAQGVSADCTTATVKAVWASTPTPSFCRVGAAASVSVSVSDS